MIIKDIVTQHAEEVAFLWLQRDSAVRQPPYKLNDLAKLDNRVEAHIDGLRIAGDDGWEICKEALAFEEPGEVFTAAVLAFESQDSERVDAAVAAGCISQETCRGLVSALGWIPYVQIAPCLQHMQTANSPLYRRLVISACAIHRVDPGPELVAALDEAYLLLQARPLRAVGELKRHNLGPVLHQWFQAEDKSCRFWAAWSALLLGDCDALDILQEFAASDSPFREQALQLVLRVMEAPTATRWLRELAERPDAVRQAILGTGILGDPLYVPWLIKLMDKPELARVAGEAFRMVTGVDLASENLEAESPEDFEAGPTDNPEDEDVAMDPDETLPWPEPSLVQGWWEKNKNLFQTGTRYLVGHPITVEHCQHVLKTGYQPQRRAAALELALLQPNEPLFNTSAPGFRQQRLLNQ